MRTVGLIAEYNPFHNGHAWHMQEAKRISGADFCIVVMSGNFVQRGAPALLDKYARTEMALSCGADLVLELPIPYALGSAEYFASGAVSLLASLGVVDTLCFGSECGDLSFLQKTAEILTEEPKEYLSYLKENLKAGNTFPLSCSEALKTYFSLSSTETYDFSALQEPNNILGIEYLKAIRRQGSALEPFTIPRTGGAYHSKTTDEGFSSATALRNLLETHVSGTFTLPETIKTEMPSRAYRILQREFKRSCPVRSRDFSLPLHYRLLSFSSSAELTVFQDVSEELAKRIFRLIPAFENFEQFTSLIKTKQYTESRIRRCLFHILLNIRAEDVACQKRNGWNGYARLLGFRKESSPLLHEIKEKSRIPLITKLADAEKILSPEEMSFLQNDLFASHVYQSVVTNRFRQHSYTEYQQKLVIFE